MTLAEMTREEWYWWLMEDVPIRLLWWTEEPAYFFQTRLQVLLLSMLAFTLIGLFAAWRWHVWRGPIVLDN